MDSTIHEPHSRITTDGIGVPTPMPVDNNNIISTPCQGVPIITNASIYNTFSFGKSARIGSYNSRIASVTNATKHNKVNQTVSKPEFQHTISKHGRTFYAFLVPKKDKYGRDRICLLNSNDYQDGYFILAYSYLRPGTNDPKPIFTAFKDYLEMYHWINSLTLEQKVGFEVILTNKSKQPSKQKPRFDVDIHFDDNPDDNKGKYTIEELGTSMMIFLPTAIEDIMLRFNVPYNRRQHLLISNSSTNEKQSYHVVIRGFNHKDHIEAKSFYELVKSKLPPYLQRYLDKAVYGPKQQFRLLGNHKINKTNVKIMDERLTLWRPEHTSDRGTDAAMLKLVTFEEFLVSYTPGCIELPSFINASTEIKIKKEVSVDLSPYEDTIRSLYGSSSFKDSGPIREFSNGIVNITNSQRFKCPICNKIHEHENPYLYVYNGSLFWDCRRHDKSKKSIYIGKINGFTTQTSVVENSLLGRSPTVDTNDNGCEFMGTYCLKHNKECIDIVPVTGTAADKLDDNLSQISHQRVPANPIINGVIPQQNILINSSQGDPKSSEAVRQTSNYIVYENTSTTTQTASIFVPTNKDDVVIKNQEHISITETALNKLTDHSLQQKILINSSQVMGQIQQQNKFINPSQIMGHASEAVRQTSNYIVYENTSTTTQTASIFVPTNKDNLAYFINYHTTSDFNSSISLNDFVEIFKKYHALNSLKYTYKNNDCVSRDIALINPNMKTKRKESKGVKTQYIVGYKFHNLDFMSVRQDVVRSFDVSQAKPIAIIPKGKKRDAVTQAVPIVVSTSCVSKEQIKKAEKQLNIATRKDWYDSQPIPRLNGTHRIDMQNRMARMEEILREANNPPTDHYLMFLKAPCGIGKTELIRDILRTAPSYLIVVGRILLGRKLEDDLLINVTKQMPDGSLKEEWIKETSFYSDIEGKVIRVNKVICTVDSLYRVEGNFDYLILDEFSYALSQLVNGSKNKRDNACALIERIKRTKNVIVADAYLQQCTVDMIDRIRNRQDKIMYENHYPKHSEKTVNELDSCGIYYAIIEAAVQARIKQCIPAGSKELANAIATNMRDELGCKIYREDEVPEVNETAYKVKIYTGDDKKYGNPTKEFHLFDAVIFTSVLEAGNSFTDPHFDECNAFFTANSCGPESAAQMILRCRNYTSGNINVLVAGGYKNKYNIPSNVETYDQFKEYIRQHIVDYRDDIRDGIQLSYIDGIDLTHEYFDLWCDVKYREHMGKKNYSDNFTRLCKSQGMQYGSYIDEEEYKSRTGLLDFEDADEKVEEGDESYFGYKMKGVCRRIKDAKNQNRIKECKDISEIYDISAEDSDRIKRDGNASSGDKLARKKFELKKRYGMCSTSGAGDNITPEFIDKVLDKSKIHTNISAFKDLSCDLDDNQRYIIKERIANDMKAVEVPTTTRDECLNKVMSLSPNETPSSDDLLKAENLYNQKNKAPHVVDRIDTTDRIKRYLSNLHAVNILYVLGFKRWLRTDDDSVNKRQFHTIDLRSFISRLESLKQYVNINYKDLQFYPNFETLSTLDIKDIKVSDKLDKKEDLTLSAIRAFIKKTLEPFDMKFKISYNRLGYYLKSEWQLDTDGYVRPLTFNPEKQPLLLTIPVNNSLVNVNPTHKIPTNHKINTNKEIKIVNETKPKIWNGKEYVESETQVPENDHVWTTPNINKVLMVKHEVKVPKVPNIVPIKYLPVDIVHTPPIGVCVNNNKVPLPAATRAKVPQAIVQQSNRIQAQPIFNNQLKLAAVNL